MLVISEDGKTLRYTDTERNAEDTIELVKWSDGDITIRTYAPDYKMRKFESSPAVILTPAIANIIAAWLSSK